jgi:hypothetical protein
MISAQFLGPHTNFMEIHFTFWLVIGLIVTIIKIRQIDYISNSEMELKDNLYDNNGIKNNSGDNNDLNNGLKWSRVPLALSGRIYFSTIQGISLIIILIIFTGSFLIGSFSGLSITATQDRGSWDNNYGFYEVNIVQGKKVRWIAPDASEVLEKKGSAVIIQVKDAYPVKNAGPNIVKFYIDNLLVKKIKLEDDSWHNLRLDIPEFVENHFSNRFTLTIVTSRSWVPKELGLNKDTRVLGIMVGEIAFIK